VEHAILALHRGVEDVGLTDIAASLEYLDPRVPEDPVEVLERTSRSKL